MNEGKRFRHGPIMTELKGPIRPPGGGPAAPATQPARTLGNGRVRNHRATASPGRTPGVARLPAGRRKALCQTDQMLRDVCVPAVGVAAQKDGLSAGGAGEVQPAFMHQMPRTQVRRKVDDCPLGVEVNVPVAAGD